MPDRWTWKDVDEYYLDSLVDNFPALAKYIACVGAIYSKPMMAYLTYMAQRIVEMHRILKDTGAMLHRRAKLHARLLLRLVRLFVKFARRVVRQQHVRLRATPLARESVRSAATVADVRQLVRHARHATHAMPGVSFSDCPLIPSAQEPLPLFPI